jgi:hypothetical protein
LSLNESYSDHHCKSIMDSICPSQWGWEGRAGGSPRTLCPALLGRPVGHWAAGQLSTVIPCFSNFRRCFNFDSLVLTTPKSKPPSWPAEMIRRRRWTSSWSREHPVFLFCHVIVTSCVLSMSIYTIVCLVETSLLFTIVLEHFSTTA